MSTEETNPEKLKTDLNSNLPFSSCQGSVSFGKLAAVHAVGRSLKGNESNDSSCSGGEFHHKEAFRIPQQQVQRFLSVDDDEIPLGLSTNAISSTNNVSFLRCKSYVDSDVALATTMNVSKMPLPDPKVQMTSSGTEDDVSFQKIAARSNQLNTDDSNIAKCFQTQAFRIPQARRQTFLSVDDEDTGDGDKDDEKPLVEMVDEAEAFDDDDVAFHGCKSTVETDIKPSFLNFEGFLEAMSENAQMKYDMTRPRRGLALIFNNDEFDRSLGLGRRSGTDADTLQLKRQFEKLDFEVYVYRNLSLEQLKRTVKQARTRSGRPLQFNSMRAMVQSYNHEKWHEADIRISDAMREKGASAADHSDADGFMCAVLTHGDNEGVIYASDGCMRLQDLLDEFRSDRCQTLLGKPKIFIIQACRGRECEVGVCEVDGVGIEETDAKKTKQNAATIIDDGICPTVPAGADFLVCYSVVEGYYSFRDTVSGSWYIQALCKAMENHSSSLEFTLLLTFVNRLVAAKCVLRTLSPQMLGRKQMPCFVSMLTKQLVFSQKKQRCRGREKVKSDCFFR